MPDDRSAHRLQRRGSRRSYQEAGALAAAMALATVWFDETDYTQVAGLVVDVYDRRDGARTHVVTQANPANQVAVPAPHADFAGRACYDFPNASAYYTSNRAPATWTYLVDESTSYAVLTPKGTAFALWVETADSTSDWSLMYNTSLRGEAARSGSSNLQQNGTVTANTPLAIEFRVSASQPRRSIRATGRSEAGTNSVSGVLENMPNTLTIGGRAGLGFGYGNMRLATFISCGSLTTDQRATMASYLLSRYGLALS